MIGLQILRADFFGVVFGSGPQLAMRVNIGFSSMR
jgi:hypothetical protein